MSPEIYARTSDLIQKYRLHQTYPVQLMKLENLFILRYEQMDEVLGAMIPPAGGWPATPRNRGRIVLNRSLSRFDARIVCAHEIGHAICHHAGLLHSRTLGLEDKHEREAWEAACMLLIPSRAVHEHREVRQVAAACEVPEWLVEIWRSLNVP